MTKLISRPYSYIQNRNTLSNHFNDIFDKAFTDFFKDDFISNIGFSVKEGTFPKCNVKLTENDLVIEAAIPGYNKEDVKITFKDDSLRITGSTQNDKNAEDKFIIREVKRSSFSRDFIIQEDTFNTEEIDAKFNNGLLTITIPRKIEQIEETEIKEISIT